MHTRLLAFGKKLLKSGVNLAVAGAGKLKNAIAGLLINFKIGKESHQLWVEKRGSGHVVMMASENKRTVPKIIEGFKTRIGNLDKVKVGNKDSKIHERIKQLKEHNTKIEATPRDKLAISDLETVAPVISEVEQYLEKKRVELRGRVKLTIQLEHIGMPI